MKDKMGKNSTQIIKTEGTAHIIMSKCSAGVRELEAAQIKCEAPIIGSLGAEPPAGSKQSPGPRVRGAKPRSPLKLKHFHWKTQICPLKKTEMQKI